MRLNASCINNCLLGLNCLLDKNDVRGKYATSIGYLDPNSSPKCDTLQFKRLASFLQKPWLAA